MRDYSQNPRWLQYLSPFRNLTLSSGYLTPFFFLNGLSVARIMILQAIFTIASAGLTTHGGLIADRYGRAFSIRLGMLISTVGEIGYGFGHTYWQFIIGELVLAVSRALISGNDKALLVDTLYDLKRSDDYTKISQRINMYGWIAVVIGVPIAIGLAAFVGIRSTLIADGLLAGVGMIFAWKLGEAPRPIRHDEEQKLSAWCAAKQLARNAEVRWLVVLGSVLSTATYVTFWLSAPYYTELGIPVIWFSAILAARSLWKAWLSHRFKQRRRLERNMVSYALMASLVYAAMATGSLWLALAVLAHDIVLALSQSPIEAKLNKHMLPEYRATMNSLTGMVQQLTYSVAGPLTGLLADKAGLGTAFMTMGGAVGLITSIAIIRLHTFNAFREGR